MAHTAGCLCRGDSRSSPSPVGRRAPPRIVNTGLLLVRVHFIDGGIGDPLIGGGLNETDAQEPIVVVIRSDHIPVWGTCVPLKSLSERLEARRIRKGAGVRDNVLRSRVYYLPP